jgi:hypothetical protein
MRNEYKILVESMKRGDHLKDLGIGGKVILDRVGRCGLDSCSSL